MDISHTYISSAVYSKEIANAIIEYSKSLDANKLSKVVTKLNEGSITDKYAALILMQMVADENAEMLSTLGDRYYSGDCVRQDTDKALKLFQKAENKGSVRSKYDLAWYYYDRKDYIQAAEYFKECIALQSALSTHMIARSYASLGNCYVSMVEPKYSEGFENLLIAANKYNDSFACRKLASLYSEVGSNYFNAEKCLKYYELAVQGQDIDAVRKLGAYYLFGEDSLGVAINGHKAASILLPFENSGDADVLRYLGILYLHGDRNNNFGVDINKACFYYEKAIILSDDARIFADLGYAYFKIGRYTDAERLLTIADKAGCLYYSDFLARMYKDGDLGSPDTQKALFYYERAFSSDCINNVFTCGEYADLLVEAGQYQKAYEVAEYGEKTYNDVWFVYIKAELILNKKVTNATTLYEAALMMELCIKHNYRTGQAHMVLANYYVSTRSYKLAESHYIDAFKLGESDAGVFLGRLYESGGGPISANTALAYEWFSKAASKGSILARKEVECWSKGIFGYRRTRRLI